jgi:hypothetical protein
MIPAKSDFVQVLLNFATSQQELHKTFKEQLLAFNDCSWDSNSAGETCSD